MTQENKRCEKCQESETLRACTVSICTCPCHKEENKCGCNHYLDGVLQHSCWKSTPQAPEGKEDFWKNNTPESLIEGLEKCAEIKEKKEQEEWENWEITFCKQFGFLDDENGAYDDIYQRLYVFISKEVAHQKQEAFERGKFEGSMEATKIMLEQTIPLALRDYQEELRKEIEGKMNKWKWVRKEDDLIPYDYCDRCSALKDDPECPHLCERDNNVLSDLLSTSLLNCNI